MVRRFVIVAVAGLVITGCSDAPSPSSAAAAQAGRSAGPACMSSHFLLTHPDWTLDASGEVGDPPTGFFCTFTLDVSASPRPAGNSRCQRIVPRTVQLDLVRGHESA